jgi:hypothetical protein
MNDPLTRCQFLEGTSGAILAAATPVAAAAFDPPPIIASSSMIMRGESTDWALGREEP